MKPRRLNRDALLLGMRRFPHSQSLRRIRKRREFVPNILSNVVGWLQRLESSTSHIGRRGARATAKPISAVVAFLLDRFGGFHLHGGMAARAPSLAFRAALVARALCDSVGRDVLSPRMVQRRAVPEVYSQLEGALCLRALRDRWVPTTGGATDGARDENDARDAAATSRLKEEVSRGAEALFSLRAVWSNRATR